MTTPVVEVVRVLRGAFPGVRVSTQAPSPRTSRFLKVDRAGGRREYGIDHMLLIVECWAANEAQAEQDALAVDNLLRSGVADSLIISGWSGGTISRFPDPDVPDHRYQVTGTLHCITA